LLESETYSINISTEELFFFLSYRFNRNSFHRPVLLPHVAARLNLSDFVYDIHSRRNFSKNSVSGVAGFVIEKIVLSDIDKKLSGSTVWCVGTRHGNSSNIV